MPIQPPMSVHGERSLKHYLTFSPLNLIFLLIPSSNKYKYIRLKELCICWCLVGNSVHALDTVQCTRYTGRFTDTLYTEIVQSLPC